MIQFIGGFVVGLFMVVVALGIYQATARTCKLSESFEREKERMR